VRALCGSPSAVECPSRSEVVDVALNGLVVGIPFEEQGEPPRTPAARE
jgi:hypothetical protein